jgi:FAD/FMN-containing dehydrogenase
MDLKTALKDIIKGDVFDDDKTLETFSKDASIFSLKPQLVVAPKDSDDIKKLVDFVNNHPELDLSLTPRAAGTCMSGGSLTESIMLDMTKYFNKIIKVGDEEAIVQPGVYYRDFEPETLKKNLLLPSYTSSKMLCTVGGMVGNNSAGEKTLTYGQTERWVKELKVIFEDGNEYVVKPLIKSELEKKIKQNDFEGKLYKRIYELAIRNWDDLQKAKPTTSKNSTGYYLWNVWNKETEIFDLTKVITGSQGTLGIITEITFKLIKPKLETAMLEIELPNLSQLDDVVNTVLKANPESFECFDDQTIGFAYKYIPDFKADFKKHNSDPKQLNLLPGFLKDLFRRKPKLVMIAEFTDDTSEAAMAHAQKAKDSLNKFSHIKTSVVSSNDDDKYWILRRDSFNILRSHSSKDLRTAPFIDDIIVRPETLPAFLPRLQKVLKQYNKKIIYTIAGHIGNGNFHIIPLMNMNKKEIRDLVPEISQKVFSLVFEFGGSMAAEHNDGLVRGPFLEKMYGQKIFHIMQTVKKIFDSNRIFNPHKKVDATFEYSYAHMSGGGITGQDYAAIK